MRLIGISRCDGDQRTPKYFDATLGYNNGAASLPTRIVVVVLTRVESWSLSVVVVTFTMSLSKKRKFSDVPDINDEPHQPREFKFPNRSFGKTSVTLRTFQKKWFDEHTWIHYDETDDKAFCHVCIQAYKRGCIVLRIF